MDGFFYSYRAADVNPLVLECRSRSRSICHGRTRNQNAQAEERLDLRHAKVTKARDKVDDGPG